LLAGTCFGQPIQPDIVAAHNAVRARHGIAPLIWSDKLARHAQEWADRLASRRQFQHRPNDIYGENLFYIEGAHASPAQVVADWASESSDYNYESNRCRKVCGHYTQIVWATTREIGCGVAREGRREVWVCNYDPPGNYADRRPY
jgi:uncharacterized protein YkwD